jgi:hypothetical protein
VGAAVGEWNGTEVVGSGWMLADVEGLGDRGGEDRKREDKEVGNARWDPHVSEREKVEMLSVG